MIRLQSDLKLNWQHPLTRGLRFAVPLTISGIRVREMVTNQFNNANLSTSASPRIVNGSMRFYGPASVNNFIFFTNVLTNIGTSPYTLLIKYLDNFGTVVFSVGQAAPVIGLNPSNYTPGLTRAQGVYHSTSKTVSSEFAAPYKYHNYGYIRYGTGTNQSEYYSDGASRGLYTHANSFSATTAQICTNQSTSPSHYGAGNMEFVYFWNRALSYAEVNSFFSNPNQIYQNKSKLINVAGVFETSSSVSESVSASDTSGSVKITGAGITETCTASEITGATVIYGSAVAEVVSTYESAAAVKTMS